MREASVHMARLASVHMTTDKDFWAKVHLSVERSGLVYATHFGTKNGNANRSVAMSYTCLYNGNAIALG